MWSDTSTFELPLYVRDFQEIQHWWVYVTGYKSAFHLCPYQFTLTPNLHTSQTELIFKFLKKQLVMHSNKIYTSLFKVCSFYLEHLFIFYII
jgi:hypothetical protein